MIDLFITLDYELFLGLKTGTPENCLIKPMKELCSVADRIGFKYIIYVDAAYLLRMSQLMNQCPQLLLDYTLVTSQIKQLTEKGHDIQLHFHPQWLFSTYDNSCNEWRLDLQHYSLSDMELNFAIDSFKAAKKLLDEIVGYETYSFRAGGYCLDSFPEYRRLFKDNGIIIDSSVARGMCENSLAHRFDYRDVPRAVIYNFSNCLTEEDINGDFTELSISSVRVNLFEYLTVVKKMHRFYTPKIVFKDGVSINSLEKKSFFGKLMGYLKGKVYLASIDGISATMLPLFLNAAKNNKCVLIGHPKNATDASIFRFSDFLEKNLNSICIKTTQDLLR